MADNSLIPTASGDETFANKDIAGVKFPKHIQVDSTGAEVVFSSLGQTTMSASVSVTIASDQSALETTLKDISNGEYETVAASQTDQVLGATGAAGDWLEGILIVPATAAAGAVSIKDGSGSSITVFAGGGTTALPTLAPIYVPLGIKSTGGAWKVTTGANVSAIGIGNFT